uniref:Uncharacterized protein n=1 Tax=Sphaerodactylus townsendi TaxID=933632 RepID=A0ACB8FYE4_9SAUR
MSSWELNHLLSEALLTIAESYGTGMQNCQAWQSNTTTSRRQRLPGLGFGFLDEPLAQKRSSGSHKVNGHQFTNTMSSHRVSSVAQPMTPVQGGAKR